MSDPDQIDMMDEHELRRELRELVRLRTPPAETSAPGEWTCDKLGHVKQGQKLIASCHDMKAAIRVCDTHNSALAELRHQLAQAKQECARLRNAGRDENTRVLELRQQLAQTEAHCSDVENEKAKTLELLAAAQAACKAKDEALTTLLEYLSYDQPSLRGLAAAAIAIK